MKRFRHFGTALASAALAFGAGACSQQEPQSEMDTSAPLDLQWAPGDEPVSAGGNPATRAPSYHDSQGGQANSAFRREVITYLRTNGDWDSTECFRFLTPYYDGVDPIKNVNCGRNGLYETDGSVYRINGDFPGGDVFTAVDEHAARFLVAAHELGHHLARKAGYNLNDEQGELIADLFALAMLHKRHPQHAAATQTWYLEELRHAMKLNPRDEHGLILRVDLSGFNPRSYRGNDFDSVFREASRFMIAQGHGSGIPQTRLAARAPS